ncbi:hypothetical protein EJ994_06880 [Maribacter sp. MJ134]|uniref:DUF6122 family protein n=1 Tax=Maribacter sp. MJ134 TaxID=2496865 RepID=UPI000F842712|nr:DUF6122 family protein [Maribacter sp. MJ134]AZQ58543.1 hypothetical protein EJ994_06880 [Maribacter sp. MJ134]
MLRFIAHYGIHFIVPLIVAYFFFKEYRWKATLILLLGIVLDIDHIFANPIFDPSRCSINFHPLHSYWAICFYVILLFFSKTRLWGIAFLIHILADVVDCLFLAGKFN